MKQILITILLIILCFGCNLNRKQDAVNRPYRILVVHSWDQYAHDNIGFDKGIVNYFNEKNLPIEIENTYLCGVPHYFDAIYEHASHNEFDVIIMEGNFAAKLLLERGKRLSTPIVLGGTSTAEWTSLRKLHTNICGYITDLDFADNFRLASRFTGSNLIEVELDHTHSDSIIRQNIRKQLRIAPFVDNLDLRLGPITTEDLSAKYKDSIIVCSYSIKNPSFNKYPSDSAYSRTQSHDILNELMLTSYRFASVQVKYDLYSNTVIDNSGRPQFTTIRRGFGDGSARFLAGYFASNESIGHELADYAFKIIHDGRLPISLPVNIHSKNFYMDWDAMKILNMSYYDYDDTYTIVNAPFYIRHPFLTFAITFLIMALIIQLISYSIKTYYKLTGRKTNAIINDLNYAITTSNIALMGSDSSLCTFRNGVFHFNEDFMLLHGIPNEGLTRSEIKAILSEETQHIVDEFFDSLSHPGTYNIRAKLIDKDNTYSWWSLRYNIDTKNPDTVYGLIINIDEQVAHEQRLIDAKRIAEETNGREEFLHNLSHEIRTPLNSILGFSQLLTDSDMHYSETEYDEFCHYILTNAERLMNIVNDVLDLSKIESGNMRFTNEIINLNDAMHSLAEYAEQESQKCEKPVSFNYHQGRKDIFIQVDRNRFTQVVSHLIRNAFEFTEEGEVTLGWLYDFENNKVHIYVEDTGPGISTEKREAIYNIFYKENKYNQGTSLGLSITRSLVQGMNGNILLSSSIGIGSRFEVVFDVCTDEMNTRLDAVDSSILFT